MKNVQRVISLLLMLSMLVGFFPSDTLRATARAEAPDPTIVEAKSFSDMPEQAAELAVKDADPMEYNEYKIQEVKALVRRSLAAQI